MKRVGEEIKDEVGRSYTGSEMHAIYINNIVAALSIYTPRTAEA
jgi:hypothetical protein